jgi:uncharacterized protein (TIGR03545 family)
MRKQFIFFGLVPLALVGFLLYLFLDSWIEAGLEYGGEKVVGAKVEIEGFRLTLSPLGVEFRRLQVANKRDPWKNVFETGKVKFALDLGQLLRGKYIIETMEVNDLVLGTERTTDGSLPAQSKPTSSAGPAASDTITPPPLPEQARPVLTEEKRKTPIFDLEKLKREFKIDSLLNVQNLRSVRYLDSLTAQIRQASEEWKAAVSDLEQSKQRVAEIEATVRSINVSELKSIEALTTSVAKVTTASKTIYDVNETFTTRRAALTQHIEGLTASAKLLDDIVNQDYDALITLARLPDVDMKGVAEALLGRDFFQKAEEYLYWIEFARTTVPAYIPKPARVESPPRFQGQDIHFPQERSYPKFWIKKILISGSEDKSRRPDYFYARGEVTHISSNQKQTDFPLAIDLVGERIDRSSFSLNAVFDRRPAVPLDTYRFKAANIPLGQISLGHSEFLPARITDAVGTFVVQIEVPGRHIEGNLLATIGNLTVKFDREPRNDVERIVRNVLAEIKKFDVQLRLWNTDGPFRVAFSTDLDNLIATRTRQVIGGEIARLKNELRFKLNQRIAQKRQEYESLVVSKKEEILGRLRSYENFLKEKRALVEAKQREVENRLDEEKKKQASELKKKGEGVLKGILKKQ